MLNEVARQCSEHYHVIVAEIDVLEYLKRCPILNECTRRVFSSLSRKAFELKAFSDRVTYKIVFYAGDIIRKEKNNSIIKIYIPILRKFILKSSTDFLIILASLRKCRNCLEYQAFPAFCVSEDTPHIMAYRSLIWRSKVVKP